MWLVVGPKHTTYEEESGGGGKRRRDVLLSIQALVLSEKPYSNEPLAFFSSYIRNACTQYNKEVFVSSCKTMLFLWRQPPKNIQGFVKENFRKRSDKILKACKNYGNGRANVGYSDHQAGASQISEDRKIMMEKVHAMLDAAFNKNQDVIPTKLPSFSTESLEQLMLLPFLFIILFLLLLFGIIFLH
ncbi:hypothetical protein RCOM_1000680 [Ricinus communis]|uniref:Uncharacterized protein n=1 Tax=Ricinus communis TaxID=3988 RepID=B9RZS0_RICCO|nr:hypothetical protein RCOM_1000680 [Ricinus communis]